jgi:GTPase SAR1 family protein
MATRELFIRTAPGFLFMYSTTSRSSFEFAIKLYEEVLRIKGEDMVPMVILG